MLIIRTKVALIEINKSCINVNLDPRHILNKVIVMPMEEIGTMIKRAQLLLGLLFRTSGFLIICEIVNKTKKYNNLDINLPKARYDSSTYIFSVNSDNIARTRSSVVDKIIVVRPACKRKVYHLFL